MEKIASRQGDARTTKRDQTQAPKAKTQIRVKFVAKPGKQIGEIYGVRLVTR